jgi:hypothetical protein
MIAKEKAKELVDQFSWIDCSSDAKQCALICVDEILNNRGIPFYFESCFEFWTEVKQEIIKL